MGMLVMLGAEIIIGIIIGLILTAIGLFFGNISLFESIATGVIARVVVHKLMGIHPGIALAIGIATIVVLYFLQTTSAGFWIVGGLYSVAWGFLVQSCSVQRDRKEHDVDVYLVGYWHVGVPWATLNRPEQTGCVILWVQIRI